jgi:hypothetical protein
VYQPAKGGDSRRAAPLQSQRMSIPRKAAGDIAVFLSAFSFRFFDF